MTKIFHPNVSSKGEICVNTLKKDWSPSKWRLDNIFVVIRCLLINPFPQSALNDVAGHMFMNNYQTYFQRAKITTCIHAKRKFDDGAITELLLNSTKKGRRKRDSKSPISARKGRIMKNTQSLITPLRRNLLNLQKKKETRRVKKQPRKITVS